MHIHIAVTIFINPVKYIENYKDANELEWHDPE